MPADKLTVLFVVNNFLPIFQSLSGDPQIFPFVPVIDNEVIPRDPLLMLKEGNFSPIPWLTGVARDEGIFGYVQGMSHLLVNIFPQIFAEEYILEASIGLLFHIL